MQTQLMLCQMTRVDKNIHLHTIFTRTVARWIYSRSPQPILWSDFHWYIASGHSVPKSGLPRSSPLRHVALVSMLWCPGCNLQVVSIWFFFPSLWKKFFCRLKIWSGTGLLELVTPATLGSPGEKWAPPPKRPTSLPLFLLSSESTWPSAGGGRSHPLAGRFWDGDSQCLPGYGSFRELLHTQTKLCLRIQASLT